MLTVSHGGGGDVVTRNGDTGLAVVVVSIVRVVWIVAVGVGVEGGVIDIHLSWGIFVVGAVIVIVASDEVVFVLLFFVSVSRGWRG